MAIVINKFNWKGNMDINLETKKLNELSNAYEKVKSSYFAAVERDLNREDGSARQDALHEQFLQENRDEYYALKAEFEAQVNLVSELIKKSNT